MSEVQTTSQPFLHLGMSPLGVGYVVIYNDRGTLRVSETLESPAEPEIHTDPADAGDEAMRLSKRYLNTEFTVAQVIPLATIAFQ